MLLLHKNTTKQIYITLDIIKYLKNNKPKSTFNLLAEKQVSKGIVLHNDSNNLGNKEKYVSDFNKKKIIVNGTAYYPPATKEWVNSIYTYNKNYIKTLPIADNVVNKLIKSYLNMYPLINNKKSKHIDIRFMRLSLNRIIVSKAEVKHTSNKIIITVYLYNRNKKFFLYKLKNLYLAKTLPLNKRKKLLLKKTDPIIEGNYIKRKIRFVTLRAVKLINKAKANRNLLFNTLDWNNNNLLYYKNKFYKSFAKDAYEIELLYMYYVKMLSLNNNKFKNWFLLGLKKAVYKLYNKNVDFNFVSLKYLHLNSDIFADSIVARIRNRENPLLAVLNRALRLAKIPSIGPNFNTTFLMLRNQDVTTLRNNPKDFPFLSNYLLYKKRKKPSNINKQTNDVLHKLLYNLFTQNNYISFFFFKKNRLNSKIVNILDAIKYKALFGVRLEAAGRLSKRLTASRSVFKLRYKGGLKNIDSSRRALSSVILRGNTNSNLQYTMVNNKTRNGSFGLKGWISGK